MSSGDPIQRLIRELSKLPGIGQKTATRLAFFVLRAPTEQAAGLARALVEVKERIRLCSVCMNLTEGDPCELCSDSVARRSAAVRRGASAGSALD
jgi:recombination protein RecR